MKELASELREAKRGRIDKDDMDAIKAEVDNKKQEVKSLQERLLQKEIQAENLKQAL
jgi:hypothetical protein